MDGTSIAAIALTFALAACGPNGRPEAPSASRSVSLGEEFQIAPGQTVQVASSGLRITFQEVPSESRCPVDVTCVWEGDATVALSLAKPSSPPLALALHANPGFQNEATYEGYRVKLLSLRPQPRSTTPIAPGDYRAVLVVLAI